MEDGAKGAPGALEGPRQLLAQLGRQQRVGEGWPPRHELLALRPPRRPGRRLASGVGQRVKEAPGKPRAAEVEEVDRPAAERLARCRRCRGAPDAGSVDHKLLILHARLGGVVVTLGSGGRRRAHLGR